MVAITYGNLVSLIHNIVVQELNQLIGA